LRDFSMLAFNHRVSVQSGSGLVVVQSRRLGWVALAWAIGFIFLGIGFVMQEWPKSDWNFALGTAILGATLVGGLVVFMPCQMTTTFHLNCQKVARILKHPGAQKDRTIFAYHFEEIASLGMEQSHDDPHWGYFPILVLKSGGSLPITVDPVTLDEAGRAIEAVSSATGLSRSKEGPI
jgi:hypothetical protein